MVDILATIKDILFGLLGFGILVLIHEFGHFIVAKALGIEVEVFSIGWGKRIWGFEKNGTDYRLSIFPIGGFVRMKGETQYREAIQRGDKTIEGEPGSFFYAAPWKRILVALAGPAINLFFAFLVFGIIAMGPSEFEAFSTKVRIINESDLAAIDTSDEEGVRVQSLLREASDSAFEAGLRDGDRITKVNGSPVLNSRDLRMALILPNTDTVVLEVQRNNQLLELEVPIYLDSEYGDGILGTQPYIESVVSRVISGSAAEQAGLQVGDRITAVNGNPVDNRNDFVALLQNSDDEITMSITRNSQSIEILVTPEVQEGTKIVGVYFDFFSYTQEGLPFFPALARGVTRSFETLDLTIKGLGALFRGLNPMNAVSGPIRIIAIGGQLASTGFDAGFILGLRQFFEFLALLSIALFFGNLLPIPVLDGGQILVYSAEALRRKAFTPKALYRYQSFGAVIVLALFLFAFFGDIMFLIQGGAN
jgi:regulator of sigma E protease